MPGGNQASAVMKARVLTLSTSCFEFTRDSLFVVVLSFPCTYNKYRPNCSCNWSSSTVDSSKFSVFPIVGLLWADSILVSSVHTYPDSYTGVELQIYHGPPSIAIVPCSRRSQDLLSPSICETITKAVEANMGRTYADPYITETIVYLEHITSKPASRLRAVPTLSD